MSIFDTNAHVRDEASKFTLLSLFLRKKHFGIMSESDLWLEKSFFWNDHDNQWTITYSPYKYEPLIPTRSKGQIDREQVLSWLMCQGVFREIFPEAKREINWKNCPEMRLWRPKTRKFGKTRPAGPDDFQYLTIRVQQFLSEYFSIYGDLVLPLSVELVFLR